MLRVCKEKGLCFWISMQYVCASLMGDWLLERSVQNDVTQTHTWGKVTKNHKHKRPSNYSWQIFSWFLSSRYVLRNKKNFKRKSKIFENYHFLCLEGTLSRCVLFQLLQHSQTVHLFKGEEGLINRVIHRGAFVCIGSEKRILQRRRRHRYQHP